MSTRSRADAFASALEDGTAPEHQPLVEALSVARTELAPLTTPDAEFRDRLRTRLLAVAAVQQEAGAAPAAPARAAHGRRWLRPLATGLTGVVVLAGAVVGVDRASRDALPGDLLYGAKRAHERIDLRFTDGELDQGIARLHLAEDRLAEVRALVARGDSTAYGGVTGTDGAVLAAGSDASRINATLRDMDELTRTGSALVLRVAGGTSDLTPLRVLNGWTVTQSDHLRELKLPPAARDQLSSSQTLVADLRDPTARELAGS